MGRLDFEVYQISIYCNIVYIILKEHYDLSVIKTSFFAYVINKYRFFNRAVYTGRNKVDILSKVISTINGDFAGFADSIPYILKALHILNQSGVIRIENDIVHLCDKEYKYVIFDLEMKFLNKAIQVSKSWTDKRFLREVLHNV